MRLNKILAIVSLGAATTKLFNWRSNNTGILFIVQWYKLGLCVSPEN